MFGGGKKRTNIDKSLQRHLWRPYTEVSAMYGKGAKKIIFLAFQTAAKFDETIKENNKAANHWKRERTRLKLEEIPDGGEKEELTLADVEDLKRLDHDDLEEEVKAMKEGIANTRPDLVNDESLTEYFRCNSLMSS